MAGQLSILVLSDAHIGKPGTATDTADVFAPLYEDIATAISQYRIDVGAVVFSGDLAFGEVPEAPLVEQYKKATAFLDSVCQSLGASIEELPILIAPGNHDIDRFRIDRAQKSFVEQLRDETSAEDIVQKMMIDNDLTWRRLLERQQAWWSFVKALPGNEWSYEDDLLLSHGVLRTPLGQIGLCALNTAWASYQPNEIGQLWIGKHQIQRASQALSDCRLRIAVMHHPVGWLHGAEKSFLEQRIESVFDVRVNGHEHAAWFRTMKGHLMLEAGAAYQGSAKENGYCFLTISNEPTGSRVYCREYSQDGAGGWRPRVLPRRDALEAGVYDVSDAFAPKFQADEEGSAEGRDSWARGSDSVDSVMESLVEENGALRERLTRLEERGRFLAQLPPGSEQGTTTETDMLSKVDLPHSDIQGGSTPVGPPVTSFVQVRQEIIVPQASPQKSGLFESIVPHLLADADRCLTELEHERAYRIAEELETLRPPV